MNRLFGTDGVRGVANQLLTPELAISLARAAAAVLAPEGGRAIIGRDSRNSGPMLEAALASGFASAGLDVCLADVIPTPAISFLIKDERAHLGAVISASHNPPEDNGIKFFDRRGMKLTMDQEMEIERALERASPPARAVGRLTLLEAAATRYAAFLTGAIDVEQIDLSGTSIVVDCAYGATATIAPRVLRHLGAAIIPLHATLDGDRINQDCGSTHLEPVTAAVLERDADLGIAFDGDGDRVMLVAADGTAIDGDRMIGIAAAHAHEHGRLSPAAVVTTVMSNLGLERWLATRGIEMVRTPVGDRFVSHMMHERRIQVGGEASGHIIFSDFSPTGDGILTAVKLLEIAHERHASLGDLAASITLYPQIHRTIPCKNPRQIETHQALRRAIVKEESALGERGRIVVRASGTQPILRLMVESEDESLCGEVVGRLAATAHQAIGYSSASASSNGYFNMG